MKNPKNAHLRNFIFGVEDSLVSTVGLLSGIAVASVPRATIILTGVVLVFVEAFSMGAGSFVSEHSVENNKKFSWGTVSGSAIMFLSYLVAGLVPLFPYIIFNSATAFPTSIIFSLLGLIILGVTKAKILRQKILHHAMEVFLIGGVAIAVGVIVGKLLENFR